MHTTLLLSYPLSLQHLITTPHVMLIMVPFCISPPTSLGPHARRFTRAVPTPDASQVRSLRPTLHTRGHYVRRFTRAVPTPDASHLTGVEHRFFTRLICLRLVFVGFVVIFVIFFVFRASIHVVTRSSWFRWFGSNPCLPYICHFGYVRGHGVL